MGLSKLIPRGSSCASLSAGVWEGGLAPPLDGSGGTALACELLAVLAALCVGPAAAFSLLFGRPVVLAPLFDEPDGFVLLCDGPERFAPLSADSPRRMALSFFWDCCGVSGWLADD